MSAPPHSCYSDSLLFGCRRKKKKKANSPEIPILLSRKGFLSIIKSNKVNPNWIFGKPTRTKVVRTDSKKKRKLDGARRFDVSRCCARSDELNAPTLGSSSLFPRFWLKSQSVCSSRQKTVSELWLKLLKAPREIFMCNFTSSIKHCKHLHLKGRIPHHWLWCDFTGYPAASHQGATMMFWLHFQKDFMLSPVQPWIQRPKLRLEEAQHRSDVPLPPVCEGSGWVESNLWSDRWHVDRI